METSRALREKWKDLDDVAVTTSISGNAEFNAAGVDKGVGLAMLRTKLGIDRMHVIAFGDNENDLEMLETVGTVLMHRRLTDPEFLCRLPHGCFCFYNIIRNFYCTLLDIILHDKNPCVHYFYNVCGGFWWYVCVC